MGVVFVVLVLLYVLLHGVRFVVLVSLWFLIAFWLLWLCTLLARSRGLLSYLCICVLCGSVV